MKLRGSSDYRSIMDRALSHIEFKSGCWEWTGNKSHGYGRLYLGYVLRDSGKPKSIHAPAHRWMYEAFIGPVPEDLVVHHLCENPGCVNPLHLRAVTQRENLIASDTLTLRQSRRTSCPRGHPYDYVHPDGSRRCRTCDRDRKRQMRTKK